MLEANSLWDLRKEAESRGRFFSSVKGRWDVRTVSSAEVDSSTVTINSGVLEKIREFDSFPQHEMFYFVQ